MLNAAKETAGRHSQGASSPLSKPSSKPLSKPLSKPAPSVGVRFTQPLALDHVRGIYVSPAAMNPKGARHLFTFMKTHGLNAMVIDVKDDHGVVRLGPRMQRMVRSLRYQHVYLIARIVVFKDPTLARTHPAWAIRRSSGGTWTQKGVPWVDPYRIPVWKYNVDIAKRARQVGFDEIQWDYVRFPDATPKMYRSAVFANPNGVTKSNDIRAFLQYARRNLPNTQISADVFGLVTTASDDMGIGQVWEKMSPYVDVLSPMMYPSHYGHGIYGLRVPESQPYATVRHGLLDALARNRQLQKKGYHTAILRPWLQDFDMRVPYGRTDVMAQIRAARQLGVTDYLLWNQGARYSP